MRRLMLACVVGLAVIAMTAPAQAGLWNQLGRYLGLGWSDGYHAPRCGPACNHWQPSVPVSEPMPHIERLPLPERHRIGR